MQGVTGKKNLLVLAQCGGHISLASVGSRDGWIRRGPGGGGCSAVNTRVHIQNPNRVELLLVAFVCGSLLQFL